MSKPEALALADRIETATANVDLATGIVRIEISSHVIDQAAAELRRLHYENKALRKDAERYRSLKWHWEDARDMAPGGRWWTSVSVDKGRPDTGSAIDAEMKGKA